MCLFDCRSKQQEEDDYIVPARPVGPTIIRTAATFPVNTSRPVSTAGGVRSDAIVLTSRRNSPRESQTSYRIVERQRSPIRSQSRSPRTSNQQIVVHPGGRSISVVPAPAPSPPRSGGGRPAVGPLQGSPGRLQFVDNDSARVAAVMLRASSTSVIPHHRRSASQVLVINGSPSQRSRMAPGRLSDSLLVQPRPAVHEAGVLIAPGRETPILTPMTRTRSSPGHSPILRPDNTVRISPSTSPRASRNSQVSDIVGIEVAGGRRSRRQSNVEIITPRGSGIIRPAREKYIVVDERGNRTELYR